MIITFCGHSTLTDWETITQAVLDILKSETADKSEEEIKFYLGGYGNFDSIADEACKRYNKINGNAKRIFITPYLDEVYLKYRSEIYDETLYPEIENVPKRYAISKRNEWMINQADLVVAYVDYGWSNSSKNLLYAHSKLKSYINLGSYRIV